MSKKTETTTAINELIDIVQKLRDPVQGCPWDLKQTHESLIPYVLEESYEVADAIRNGDNNELCEELGDLLLQVILHAQIAREKNIFSLADIAKGISRKLIRRHPHVFNEIKKLNVDTVNEQWKKIKISEKPLIKTNHPTSDHLRKKVSIQPALAGAMTISKKVAKLGFEWENIEAVWTKLNEELEELKTAIKLNDKVNAQEELGDVFFTLINIARWSELDPEEGLAGSNKRFLDRFSYIESSLKGNLENSSLNKLKSLWKEAKAILKINK